MINLLISAFESLEYNDSDFISLIEYLCNNPDPYQASLYHVLKNTAEGNPDSMNEWLFSLPPNYTGVIGWLAKVQYLQTERFVWMVGVIDDETALVRDFINNNWYKANANPLLACPRKPPFLLYLKPSAQSTWQQNLPQSNEEKIGDFSMFQVDYKGEKLRDDIDQLMAMNSIFLCNQVYQIFEAMKMSCSEELLEYFEKNVLPKVGLLSKLHTELHNYGHFIGAFPYDNKTKNCDEYEAVEEYKACLVAIELVSTLSDDLDLVNSFALLVVCTRIFGYGLRSYLVPEKTVQLVREISVGLFFFEQLKNNGVLKFDKKISIEIPSIRLSTKKLVQEIDASEAQAKENGNQILVDYAVHLYSRSYPNKCLSPELSKLYGMYT